MENLYNRSELRIWRPRWSKGTSRKVDRKTLLLSDWKGWVFANVTAACRVLLSLAVGEKRWGLTVEAVHSGVRARKREYTSRLARCYAFKNIVIRLSANVNKTTVSIVRVGTRFLASLSAPCCSQLNCAPVKSRPKLSVSGASRAAAHSVQYTTVPALGLFGGWGGCAPCNVNTVVTSFSCDFL